MITAIEVVDNSRTPKHYFNRVFKDGTTIHFNPGVNILIGKNGCGKTTLLDTLAQYTLCKNTIKSQYTPPNVMLEGMLDEDGMVYDGVRVRSDYSGCVFNFIPQDDKPVLKDTYDQGLIYNSLSLGEIQMSGLDSLFEEMFSSGNTHQFPITELKDRLINFDDYWSDAIESLLRYYKQNYIKIPQEQFEYTALIDEPDKNLDVENLMQLYQILSFHKPKTQIIVSLHNPLLIYKLSERKSRDINIIELTPNYLNSIYEFIEK